MTVDIYGLSQCIYYWPEDGRPYVALGKVFSKLSKMNEARAVYEKGCQATQGENPYIWQVDFFMFLLKIISAVDKFNNQFKFLKKMTI